MPDCQIRVFSGGVGPERLVSLKSGEAVVRALSERYDVCEDRLDAAALPKGLDPERDIVFPALHGVFGEDGDLQALLEAAGIEFCGSCSESSRICMDKGRTKEIVRQLGIAVPEGEVFVGDAVPLADDLMDRLGTSLVLKPVASGSSDGLLFTNHRSELGVALSQIHSGRWLAERRIMGRELTVGLLDGKALGVVEIIGKAESMIMRRSIQPARRSIRARLKSGPMQPVAYRQRQKRFCFACGCRDFARVDFLLEDETPYFWRSIRFPALRRAVFCRKARPVRGTILYL